MKTKTNLVALAIMGAIQCNANAATVGYIFNETMDLDLVSTEFGTIQADINNPEQNLNYDFICTQDKVSLGLGCDGIFQGVPTKDDLPSGKLPNERFQFNYAEYFTKSMVSFPHGHPTPQGTSYQPSPISQFTSLADSKGWVYETNFFEKLVIKDACAAEVFASSPVQLKAANFSLVTRDGAVHDYTSQTAECSLAISGIPTSGLQAFVGSPSEDYFGVATITKDGRLQVYLANGTLKYVSSNSPLLVGSLVEGPGNTVFAVDENHQIVQFEEVGGDFITHQQTHTKVKPGNIAVSNNGDRVYAISTAGKLVSSELSGDIFADSFKLVSFATFAQGSLVNTDKGVVVASKSGSLFKVEGTNLSLFSQLSNQQVIPNTLTYGGKNDGREVVYAITEQSNHSIHMCFIDTLDCVNVGQWGGHVSPNSLVGWDDRIFGTFDDGRIFNTYNAGNGQVGFATLTTTYKPSVPGSLATNKDGVYSVADDGTLLFSYWAAGHGWLQTQHDYGATQDPKTWLVPGSLKVDDNKIVYGINRAGKQIRYNAGTQKCYSVDGWDGITAQLTAVNCYIQNITDQVWTRRDHAFNKENVVLRFDKIDPYLDAFEIDTGLEITGWVDDVPVVERTNLQNQANGELKIQIDTETPTQIALKPGYRIRISHQQTHGCLYSPNASNGSNIRAFNCFPSYDQVWQIKGTDESKYINLMHTGTSKAMYVNSGTMDVDHWDWWYGDKHMKFELVPRGDAWQIRHKETNSCLYITEKATNTVHAEACSTDNRQLFHLSIVK
ncbi:RICIN domain-containing protein [Catenovulum sp. SM1970]|uniref:RICIN domain-containing protein n=1 Tax=Marinifaba aquimaris TaxID=2741323 RepID=UPI00157244C4|nr:RICIN domain-containing protein [Marinifaba aquimaris]NTS78301.1 RICIN domain-containing protein [Marinifaba aquimaris]